MNKPFRKLPRLPALRPEKYPRLPSTPIPARFYLDDCNLEWYPIEYDPERKIFYGFVTGFQCHFNYFTLSSIKSIRGPMDKKVRVENFIEPLTLEQVTKYYVNV